ncbi:MAG: Nif3-like dinuclear metal center hexameric protein [Lentisphaerae bacterium]|nr:Nif3-like dinuclear metal center hexameric protein [Lentisphaerota bacterium]
MNIAQVADFYNQILQLENFAADPSNNGLQVCGDASRVCRKIAFAVDACGKSIEAAARAGADMLLVHHGLSWGGGLKYLSGVNGQRLAGLYKNDLALYAVHLPLDAHKEYGNNAVLADLAGLSDRQMFFPYHGMDIGVLGQTAPVQLAELAQKTAVGKEFKIYASPLKNDLVSKVAVVSGGGGVDGLECAIASGADVLITGEFDHVMYHVVQENKIHVIALGHYNSEVHGVQALQKLADGKLDVATLFLDLPTGL